MTHITSEHLHHLAKRHHATMKKLDSITGKVAEITSRFVGTAETGGGAWLGGVLEGKTNGRQIGPIPLNLAIGAGLLVAGHVVGGQNNPSLARWGDDLSNFGTGFIGSYLAATGYAFGKRWQETGKLFGGGGHPWTHPYEEGWQHGGAPAAP